MPKGLPLFFGVATVGLVLDQAVKWWVRGNLAPGQYLPGGKPWPGVFEITLSYNEGVAFGMFQGRGVLLTPVAIAIGGFAVWYALKNRNDPAWSLLAMGLLCAGAIGNLIDRLWLGKVTDMFYFRPINFPVFNVADACITLAAALLVWGWTLGAKTAPAES